MKVVTQAIPVIKFSPRFYPSLSDTLVLTMDNGNIIPFSWVITKNNIVATLGNTTGLIQGENYSFTITRGQEIIYKGKIIFVADNTDIQNYSNKSQNTKRWE
jgi:hypothetical protein